MSSDTLRYAITFEDPATWTEPWTMVLFMKKSEDPIFEYVCH